MIRFGITMRITEANGYEEQRESIASDWCEYMMKAFPKAQFVFIPNLEYSVKQYIQELDVNVLIISGGDDLGLYPRRDRSEIFALEYALENHIPVIGVCRGLQLIHSYFGGQIIEGNAEFVKDHRASKHEIDFKGESKIVNSYHTNEIVEESISAQFEIIARCKADNSVEAIQNESILAMMWHPERDLVFVDWNKELIENFINT
ncbi:gamma-glutamyl-gamma-aminobutyrate hydrolase family protein [Brumimicrobium oceani]|uniref:Glutamine amidotransferase domain-containing protein n=1 Tax=Brumimicrobium oceani TaxID=2100725 RepID=A0A2U2XGW8_9FLAO|nr:gamma-glutamyl-gamma-aminobutyrate hydrolase family protein [Brumimicrobium oceani]PWH86997.1 hypothetical protein DIT68_01700 [Brumimicrobium oceani]